jgi:hypothetical protein
MTATESSSNPVIRIKVQWVSPRPQATTLLNSLCRDHPPNDAEACSLSFYDRPGNETLYSLCHSATLYSRQATLVFKDRKSGIDLHMLFRRVELLISRSIMSTCSSSHISVGASKPSLLRRQAMLSGRIRSAIFLRVNLV